MSKNIVIQEGGTGVQLTVDKMKTGLVGGGTCLWVPEDEVNLGVKNISRDGTYIAANEGLYGYSKVIVKGTGSMVGKDPSGSGDEIQAYVDETTGDLLTRKIPSYIEIVQPPTSTTYTRGQQIDYSGMVVKAMLLSGNVFTDTTYPSGVIPISQLTLPMKTAEPTGGESEDRVSPSGDVLVVCASIGNITGDPNNRGYGTYRYVMGNGKLTFIQGENTITGIYASESPGAVASLYLPDGTTWQTVTMNASYTYGGRTVYYNAAPGPWQNVSSITPETTDPISDVGKAAWTMIFGTAIGLRAKVPVRWTSIYDGREMEDTFNIVIVNNPGGQGED